MAMTPQHRLTLSLAEDQFLALDELACDANQKITRVARDALWTFLADGPWRKDVTPAVELCLTAGYTNAEAVESLGAEFPLVYITEATVRWYRVRLRGRNTEGVETDAYVRRKRGLRPARFDRDMG